MQATIYMGSKCNLNCAYCHREEDERETGLSANLLEQLKKQDNLTVKFMGGEPTLYMDEIKQVVAALPKAKFAICTNGVNLEAYLPFFKKHDFLVCISFDGGKNSERGFDPFTKLIDYPKLAVSTTLHHGHTDLRSIITSFAAKERIIGRQLSFFPHFAHATNTANDTYALSLGDAEYILRQYKEMVGSYMEQRFKYGVRNFRYEGMFTGLLKRYQANFSYGETYCVNKNLKRYNTSGESFTCLYIRDEKLSDNWQTEQQRLLDEKFPECRCCPVYFMCGGGCIKTKSRDIECYINKMLFSWFKAEYEKWKGAGYAD